MIGQLPSPAALPPGKEPSALTEYETWWTSVQIEALRRRQKYFALAGNGTAIIQTSSPQPIYYAEYAAGFMFNSQVQRKISCTVIGISLLNGSSEQLHGAETLQKSVVPPLVKNFSACKKIIIFVCSPQPAIGS